MNKVDKELSLNYVWNSSTNQAEDNFNRRGDIKSTYKGVNYQLYRKQIAKYLKSELRSMSFKLPNSYVFTAEGISFFTNLIENGPTESTVRSWLKKYEGFDGIIHKKWNYEQFCIFCIDL